MVKIKKINKAKKKKVVFRPIKIESKILERMFKKIT